MEKMNRLTITDVLNIISSTKYSMQCPLLLNGATHCREGERNSRSLILPASEMEKQFITLSDSLSKTDMIKNNIK